MLGERIKQLREMRGFTQLQLADKLETSQKTISSYEVGRRIPPSHTLETIATFFGVSIDYLLGKDSKTQGIMIPLVGQVSAGLPLYAENNITGYEEIDPEMKGEFFALKIKGDSMAPRMIENDVVIIRKQSHFNSGDVCVVLVNGEEATIKKVQQKENGIMLIPNNINHMPTFFTWSEVESLPVAIIGVAVELRGKL
jgi:repressor LexA